MPRIDLGQVIRSQRATNAAMRRIVGTLVVLTTLLCVPQILGIIVGAEAWDESWAIVAIVIMGLSAIVYALQAYNAGWLDGDSR